MEIIHRKEVRKMIKVVCCVCDKPVYLKPGDSKGYDSHGFCPKCLRKYCDEKGLEPIEIFIPEGAVLNPEVFPDAVC